MKVKDISRTANIAWSPTQQYPIYLAAGTAAQQLDATFRYVYCQDPHHILSFEKQINYVANIKLLTFSFALLYLAHFYSQFWTTLYNISL